MTITSTFYDTTAGNGVKETDWGKSAISRGATYGVVGADDLMLTPHPSAAYTLNLSTAAGFYGHGVWDTSDAIETLPAATPPATGVKRWDMVAAHRDMQPVGGGPTTLILMQGNASRALPATRANNPGVVTDQPLWLVEWTGGQTQPTAIVDLRCWASNGGVVAADDLARNYLNTPGARVMVGTKDWAYLPGANGAFGWVDLSAPAASVALWLGNGSTAYSSQPAPTMRMVSPGNVRVEGVFKPGTSTDGASLLSIPTSMRPTYSPPVTQNKKVAYRTTSSTYGVAFAQVQPGGSIVFYGLPPSTDYVELGFGWFL